jgi:hypothetical protein
MTVTFARVGSPPMKPSAWCLGTIVSLLLVAPCTGDDVAKQGTSRALIVVGLPGDPAHEALWRSTASRWKDWLVNSLGFAPGEVRVLSGPSGGSSGGWGDAPATRESIEREVEAFGKKATADDRAWVFVLGHANLDDGHAFLHLPGPDLRDDDFATLFRGLAAKEQVFWMTNPASGAFLAPLSAAGRIVFAATEPSGEVNETEFPHALAEVAGWPREGLDIDKNEKVSVFELFLATVAMVERRFKADKRAPTEHAQIDDDGDGIGSEQGGDLKSAKPDGALAGKTFLPIGPAKTPTTKPARSEHGTDRVVPPPR